MPSTAALRAELIHALRVRGSKLVDRGDVADFQCPRHEDGTPSAWIGDHAWGCYACGFTESLRTLADELGVPVPAATYTIEDYALEKGFNVARLREWGVESGDGKIVIPYHDESGKLLRNKFRGANGATFWEGKHQPIYLYGLDRLAQVPKDQPVIVVEGESDCHACWHHDVAAVGVPGAKSWRSDWAPRLRGRDLYVWQEPDKAGEEFVRSLSVDFPEAKLISGNGVKDVADLHKARAKDFRSALSQLMDSAVPIGASPCPVTFDAAIGDVLDRIIEDAQRPVDAVPTPLPSWNAVCRDEGGGVGLARGWHVVLGGTTGQGKSLFAINLGVRAIRHGERVAFVSLEMSQRQIVTRALAIASGLPVRKLERGKSFDVSSAKQAAAALDEIHAETGGCFYVNRSPVADLQQIQGAIRYEHEVHGCRFFAVDYLQLAWSGSAGTLFENVQQVSHVVRRLAVDLDVTMIGLSQYNRQTTTENTPPQPQGLLGGSVLENDADQVVLLDHSKYERTVTGATTRAIVGKNRHGAQVRIPVTWDYGNLRLSEDTDWDEVNREDRPL